MSKLFESQHIEWKETWRDEYLKWICGFANAQGGVLEIGKNDQGKPVGINNARKLLEDLPNKIRDLLGIIVEVNLLTVKGKELLEIHVSAYPNPISYRGHYYQRSGSTLQELKGASLDRFLLRSQGRTWDSVPVPGVENNHLSITAINQFRKLAATSGRLDDSDLSISDAELLEKLMLTEGHYLRRSAILLFHDTPERFITGAFVKIGFFRSESEIVYHDEIHGDLFTQSSRTIDLLQTKYMNAAITYKDIQRIERYPVPRVALREGVLNALVHRDYAVSAPIQIRVYEDRLKIWNPIVLPEGWSLEKLLGEHSPYNPGVANCFFRAGEIESWGRGIQRIFQACRESSTPEPIIRLSGNDLWLEFPFKQNVLNNIQEIQEKSAEVNSNKLDKKLGNQLGNRLGNELGNQLGNRLGNELGNRLGNELGNTNTRIITAMKKNPQISGKQLANILKISTTAVEKHIKQLRESDKIQRMDGTRGHWKVLNLNNIQEIQEKSAETHSKKLDEKLGNRLGNELGNTKTRIMTEMKKNPQISSKQLANILKISTTAVEKHIKQLREVDKIQRMNGTRGHWKVLDA
jgi:ATP-dependent DNA helicase RecG